MPERASTLEALPGACGMAPRAPLLVLGLGNVLLRDEGVGVHVVEALAGLRLPVDVELCDGGTAGFALLNVLAGRRKVIVLDAVDHGAIPGTIIRLRAEDLAARPGLRVSLHELGLAETLLAAGRLRIAPAEVVVLGIQPAAVEWGLALSPEIERRVPDLVRLALAEIGSEL